MLAPVGIFCIFFANGAIYGTSTRFIDSHLDGKYSLVAMSVWLFVGACRALPWHCNPPSDCRGRTASGDIGSVAGSNILEYVRVWFCAESHKYVCVTHGSDGGNSTANAAVALGTSLAGWMAGSS